MNKFIGLVLLGCSSATPPPVSECDITGVVSKEIELVSCKAECDCEVEPIVYSYDAGSEGERAVEIALGLEQQGFDCEVVEQESCPYLVDMSCTGVSFGRSLLIELSWTLGDSIVLTDSVSIDGVVIDACRYEG